MVSAIATFERSEIAQRWLEGFLAAEGAAAGTVHVQRGEDLFLVAASRIPEPVIAVVAVVLMQAARAVPLPDEGPGRS